MRCLCTPLISLCLHSLLPFPLSPHDDIQYRRLGEKLAALHLSHEHDALHKGRFGFAVSNFLALTPLNNTWDSSWPSFFARRLESQIVSAYKDKTYGRAALNQSDMTLMDLGMRVSK